MEHSSLSVLVGHIPCSVRPTVFGKVGCTVDAPKHKGIAKGRNASSSHICVHSNIWPGLEACLNTAISK